MNTMQILSVVVFLVVMAAIVSEKIHRTVAAVAGGVVLVCLHVLTAVSYTHLDVYKRQSFDL